MTFAAARQDMVDRQVAARGVHDPRVLAAMRTVPRERFVSPGREELAYEDAPLPIACGQTISQPFIVALMAEAAELDGTGRVLEVGTGSGYGAAVLSCLATHVYSVERHAELAADAERRLRDLGFDNVTVVRGDGTLGLAEHAPYDAIVVTAGAPHVPAPLIEQLAPAGRLIIPVGSDDRSAQTLLRLRRVAPDEIRTEELGPVRFVPLIGNEGWAASPHQGRFKAQA